MIRTILSLSSTPEGTEDVLEMYRREGILQFSLDHSRAVASEISVATDGSGDIVVTALWPDEVAYKEWVDHPYRRESAPRLAGLLAGACVGVARAFEIDHAVSKETTELP